VATRHGKQKPYDQGSYRSAGSATDHRRTHRQRNGREQERQNAYLQQGDVEIAKRAKILKDRQAHRAKDQGDDDCGKRDGGAIDRLR
jgi:hypothetical protein